MTNVDCSESRALARSAALAWAAATSLSTWRRMRPQRSISQLAVPSTSYEVLARPPPPPPPPLPIVLPPEVVAVVVDAAPVAAEAMSVRPEDESTVLPPPVPRRRVTVAVAPRVGKSWARASATTATAWRKAASSAFKVWLFTCTCAARRIQRGVAVDGPPMRRGRRGRAAWPASSPPVPYTWWSRPRRAGAHSRARPRSRPAAGRVRRRNSFTRRAPVRVAGRRGPRGRRTRGGTGPGSM